MPKPDETELTPDQELELTRKEILEDGVWCVYDRSAFRDENDEDDDRDDFEELEIVLSPYSNFMRTPICRVEQTGRIGREVAARICASGEMLRILKDVQDYFTGEQPHSSAELKSRIASVIQKTKPEPT